MPKRKIYDILPPNKRLNIFKGEEVKKEAIYKNRRAKIKKNFIYILLLIFLILVVYWNFSSAKKIIINISPQTYKVDFTATLNFSTALEKFSLSELEISDPLLPAELMEAESVFSKEFNASTAQDSQKATGVIKVYNEANRNITLVEGTRFLSSTDPTRLFRSQKRITIPSGGNIDVPVIAAEAGPEYNIKSASFSIPGLRNFSPPQLYYDVYGKSFDKMIGGTESEVKIISKDDIERAQKEIIEWAKERAEQVLREKAGQDYKILDKSIEYESLEQGLIGASIGEQKDIFTYEIKLKATTLAVKTAYLQEFAREYLLSSIPANKQFVEDKLELQFLPTTFAVEAQANGVSKATADISIKGKIYSDIDKEAIKEIAKGRKKNEILRYTIEIYPDLEKQPKVIFKPFWVKKACQEDENIEIQISFD
jgi:hypothetical protein